jgi:hypothetical protein
LTCWSTFLIITLVHIAFCLDWRRIDWSRHTLSSEDWVIRLKLLLLFTHWFGTRWGLGLRIRSCHIYDLNRTINVKTISLNLISARDCLAFLTKIFIEIL